MIFKVTYQPTKFEAPTRENTESLYLEAGNQVEARRIVEQNTPYNIEFIQPMDGKHLEYEQNKDDFHITEFNV